ncbi:MAG: DUF1697 domain-containing protein [Bacteroidetes bacterium]|nr:DUF1697 domain-containing protein [Bacteroidota bacterium]
METYISLLRGINVSGQKKVNMKDLKGLYESLGYSSVSTYIQSGNVVFSAETQDKSFLTEQIKQKIFEFYAFVVPVLIRDISEIQNVILKNPFVTKAGVEEQQLYVTFLSEEPQQDLINQLKASDFFPEGFVISDREIFLNCTNGYGKTKLNNSFFERKLKVNATTRNWRTVNELLKMGK